MQAFISDLPPRCIPSLTRGSCLASTTHALLRSRLAPLADIAASLWRLAELFVRRTYSALLRAVSLTVLRTPAAQKRVFSRRTGIEWKQYDREMAEPFVAVPNLRRPIKKHADLLSPNAESPADWL
jgi:hypothetical protein